MYVNAYDAFKVMVYVHNAHQVSYHLSLGPFGEKSLMNDKPFVVFPDGSAK